MVVTQSQWPERLENSGNQSGSCVAARPLWALVGLRPGAILESLGISGGNHGPKKRKNWLEAK